MIINVEIDHNVDLNAFILTSPRSLISNGLRKLKTLHKHAHVENMILVE